jgi:hypothetical protein
MVERGAEKSHVGKTGVRFFHRSFTLTKSFERILDNVRQVPHVSFLSRERVRTSALIR